MTIDINELRRLMQDFKLAGSPMLVQTAQMSELLDRLEAAEKERDNVKAAAENIALKLDYLRSKLETAENAQNDWLRANAPGGWIDNLRVKVKQMDAAFESLLIRCDDSDSAMCGTLSTSFVRDTVRIARGT